MKETDIVDSCDKVIGHCANHSGSPGFKVYLNKTMLFSVWTYQELADALSIFEDNVKKRLKVVCGELTIKAIYVLEKKLLLTVNLWPEVEKFISSLDKSIMDSVRISHHPNWNGICWNSIKDEKCYMLIYDDDEILFKSEGSSIPFRSDEYWNEVEVVDFKNNLKQIAKLKREINEYCTKYAKDS